MDNSLATSGIIVFRVDPRSASGKGAQSAWTCYKQLGVQELKDLEEAVAWLCKNPCVDATRVGISGHSYGGFMAAFALTHSKTFSAGIAGAPGHRLEALRHDLHRALHADAEGEPGRVREDELRRRPRRTCTAGC